MKTVLVIQQGIGASKLAIIKEKKDMNLSVLSFPEFDSANEAEMVERLVENVRHTKPDLIIAGSRAGKLICGMWSRGISPCPFLLLSIVNVSKQIMGYRQAGIIPAGTRALVVHGIKDITIPIHFVRNIVETGTPGLVKLIELDTDHSLQTLVEKPEQLHAYIDEAIQLQEQIPSTSKPKNTNVTMAAFSRANLMDNIRSKKKE